MEKSWRGQPLIDWALQGCWVVIQRSHSAQSIGGRTSDCCKTGAGYEIGPGEPIAVMLVDVAGQRVVGQMVLDVRAYLRNVFEYPSRGCEPERTAGIADSSRQLGVVREVYSGDPLAVCIVEFVGRLDVAGGDVGEETLDIFGHPRDEIGHLN